MRVLLRQWRKWTAGGVAGWKSQGERAESLVPAHLQKPAQQMPALRGTNTGEGAGRGKPAKGLAAARAGGIEWLAGTHRDERAKVQ